MYKYTNIYIYIYVYIYVYIHIYICVYVYMFIYIYIYVCVYVYIHVYIYMYVCISLSLSVHARPGSCGVNRSPVAMPTGTGANGGPGLSARSLVEEESSPGDASVITPPLRAVGGAAWASLHSRTTATHTCAQV